MGNGHGQSIPTINSLIYNFVFSKVYDLCQKVFNEFSVYVKTEREYNFSGFWFLFRFVVCSNQLRSQPLPRRSRNI